MNRKSRVFGAGAAVAVGAASMGAQQPAGAQAAPSPTVITTTATGAQLDAPPPGWSTSGTPSGPTQAQVYAARQSFVAQSAASGVNIDIAQVKGAVVGHEIVTYANGAGPASIKVVEEVVDGVRQVISINTATTNETPADGATSSGIGFAGTAPGVLTCHYLNTPAGKYNYAKWCWRKTRVTNDGDDAKDYYSYKRTMMANPTTDPWFDYGVTEMKIESHPTPGAKSRFKDWTDWKPTGYIENTTGGLNLGIGVGPLTVTMSNNMSGGANPTVGDPGVMSVRWTTGIIRETGRNEDIAFHQGVQVGQGQTPYWGDTNKACFSNFITNTDCYDG